MMYEEFEKLITTEPPTQEEYKVIEKVYTTHPAFDVAMSKQKTAQLYDLIGFSIFKEMLPKAEEAEKIREEIRLTNIKLDKFKEQLKEISRGYSL